MDIVLRLLQWVFWNAERISSLLAAAGVLGAVRIYYRKVALERATWLSSLYSKFYEAPDLKRIRKVLDDNPPDSPQVEELVRNEDPDLTDYLNFFEFMAYLEARSQLNRRDVVALFDYYLRLLSKHKDVRRYVLDDRNGYGYLKKLLPRFPPVISGSDHDSPSICIRNFISATRAAGDRRYGTPASPGGAGVGSRPPVRPWRVSGGGLE